MTKLIKRPCPYFPDNCTASIKKEDLSCYDICNVYQDWNTLISKYENHFDKTPFNTQQVIKELKTKNGAVERLNYWLENYSKPLYEWIESSNEPTRKQETLRDYQNSLKYWQPNKLANGKHNPNFTLVGRLSFPVVIYEACFKEYENSPEFEYWNLVFDANITFRVLLKVGEWEKKAKSPLSTALFQATIHRIEDEEREATSLMLANAFDIYRRYNPFEYNKQIALLRIKKNLYKDGSFVVPKNCNVAEIYANHLLLKPYLQELSNKHLDTNYWIHDIDKEEASQSFLSCKSQIGMHGFYQVANTKVYTPLLAHVLTEKFEARKVSSKKAPVLIVDGLKYIPSYKEGYQEGIAYFKDNYSVPPSVLYGDGAKNYIDDLHYNYCHKRHDKLQGGWQFVKSRYPKSINNKIIKMYGYYAGIVSEVDRLISQYPTLFVNFHTCALDKEAVTNTLDTKSTTKNKSKPVNNKTILIKDNDAVNKVFDLLKGFFTKEEQPQLLKALKGTNLTTKLHFPHSCNKFVEVFRRLKYNGYVINTPTELRSWICTNFTYFSKTKQSTSDFNENTVWDILSKGKGEVRKDARICEVEWLPYKNPNQLKKEKQQEKL